MRKYIVLLLLILASQAWGFIVELDTENDDRDLTSLVTVLTDTPDGTYPMLCQGYIVLGDGAKDLNGDGGVFEFVITVGGQTIQPSPEVITFGTEPRSAVWTSQFVVPENTEVILRAKSPNGADTSVDVTAYLYDIFPVSTIAGGVILADTDHTINKLIIAADTGVALSVSSGGGNGNGAFFSGNGSGEGFSVLGGATGNGMEIRGGATSGSGMKVWADGTNDYGLEIVGIGNKAGMSATGGATGHGLQAVGGGGNTYGAYFNGEGSGSGVYMQGGASGNGLFAQGGDSAGAGAYFKGANDGDGDGIKAESGDSSGWGFTMEGDSGDIDADEIDTLLSRLGSPANIDSGGATIADNLKKIADDSGGAGFDATTDSLQSIRDAIGLFDTSAEWLGLLSAVDTDATSATHAPAYVTLEAGKASNDAYNGMSIAVTDATDSNTETRRIEDWTSGLKATFDRALSFTPVQDDIVRIYSMPYNVTAAIAGGSANTFIVTDTGDAGGTPIADVSVWVTADSAGARLVVSGVTDSNGAVVFYLDAGTTYYVWMAKSGFSFSDNGESWLAE